MSLAALGAFGVQRRRRDPPWRWWAWPTFALGWLLAAGAVVSPLDEWGERGSLSAHVTQHMILGDLAAPLLLIGLPPAVSRIGRRLYERATRATDRRARVIRLALSPAGAIVLWAVATYVWVAPPVHRYAIQDGVVRLVDQLSFLVFGLVVWLAAFEFRNSPPVRDWESLKATFTSAGLPWWARHIYAMVSRLAMLPAVVVLWFAGTSGYYLSAEPPPGGMSQHDDQLLAASIMLGFEILLSALSVVLAFVWVSISDGRARQESADRGARAGPARRRRR